ncbi:acyl-CoA Delta-9 desaturase [Halyomorpha halys]|uniref:acyl-CoA Delta-9 desaturase n=1 Tax=Halyomorpha halys TaxID=286706 RepID=UPI0006D4F5A6|nr:acyl-CoA Delta(11) desaturase-like [Halyomorpha halys]
MSPNLTGSATGLFLAEAEVTTAQLTTTATANPTSRPKTEKEDPYAWKIVWRNVLAFVYLHVGALYGLYLAFTVASGYTVLWSVFIAWLGGMGVTAGAHRLWSHRSYKAKWPLRVLLALLQCMAFQNHLYEWVRDHRVHHKFTDTDADPHNAKRGFFFSHIGWLMVRKHPDVAGKGKVVDMSDLERDWVIRWQRTLYPVLMPLLCFVFPTWVPVKVWGEAPWASWYVAGILRYTLSLNGTWLVNSAAHIWGMKPYDKTISASENLTVACIAFGEGWHNYHHAFPWDYKTSEFHGYRTNVSKAFIDFFAKIGWAYNLKTVPQDLIKKRVARTGDITAHHESDIWGWGDKDIDKDEKKMVIDFLKDHKVD